MCVCDRVSEVNLVCSTENVLSQQTPASCSQTEFNFCVYAAKCQFSRVAGLQKLTLQETLQETLQAYVTSN